MIVSLFLFSVRLYFPSHFFVFVLHILMFSGIVLILASNDFRSLIESVTWYTKVNIFVSSVIRYQNTEWRYNRSRCFVVRMCCSLFCLSDLYRTIDFVVDRLHYESTRKPVYVHMNRVANLLFLSFFIQFNFPSR